MNDTCRLEVHGPLGPGQTPSVVLPRGSDLAHALDLGQVPVLFGCRTGICGTCVSRVRPLDGSELPEPDEDEQETLDLFATGEADARLLCRLRLDRDLSVSPLRQGRLSG